MALVAQGKEIANLIDKNPSTTSAGIDEDLQHRIRSLFNSRNERNPARVPLPSPEMFKRTSSYYNNDEENLIGSDPEDASLGVQSNKASLKRRSRMWRSEVGSSRFDGSDVFSRLGSNTLSRHTTPESSRTASPTVISSKGQTRTGSDMSRTTSTASKPLIGDRNLRYSIRVVPPKRTTQDDLHVRPSMMHIPGSYRSESSPREDLNLAKVLKSDSGPTDGRFKENIEFNDLQGIISGPPPSATAALQQARTRGQGEPSQSNIKYVDVAPENTKSLSPMKSHVEPTAPSRRSSLRHFQSDESYRPLSQSTEKTNRHTNVDQDSVGRHSRASQPRSILSGYSSVSQLDRVSSPISVSQNQPRGSSLTARPSEQRKPALENGLYRAGGLAPVAIHESEHAAADDLLSPIETESQDSNKKNQAFIKVIDNLESLLTEALQIADKSEGVETRADEGQASVENLPGKDCSTDSSCTSSVLSSSSATDDERIQTRLPIKQTKKPEEDKIAWEEQFDGVPWTQSQRDRPIDMAQEKHPATQPGNPVEKPAQGPTRGNSHQYSQMSDTSPFVANDWAYNRKSSENVTVEPRKPPNVQQPLQEISQGTVRRHDVHDQQRGPLVHARTSSFRLNHGRNLEKTRSSKLAHDWSSSASDEEAYLADINDTGKKHQSLYQGLSNGDEYEIPTWKRDPKLSRDNTLTSIRSKEILSHPSDRRARQTDQNEINLSNRHNFSIREPRGFSLSRSHRRKPIARDWSTPRKRFVATVTCITTSLLGLALGIYAGEVPAIQYTIGDEHHYTILGNVFFFLGLATSTILLWPLPVLHGRKPYTIVALALLLPLQFPQALSVNDLRSPDDKSVRIGILLPRAISGVVMGFANINFMSTLLDLFGASLQSRNPHQEVVTESDVRRHGGGMGAWLGIWTWCSAMSIGVGFLIGAGVISAGPNDISGSSSVSWGFWIVIIAAAFVLLLNVIVPETRRSAYRRSMAEVRTGTELSRRVARGEIKMHMDQTGPKIWHEELVAGYRLTLLMIKQPGFLVLSLYQGWIYGQIVLIIALLGALLSKYYHFHPQYVGLGVSIIPFGALFGVPFQIAGIFSRSRKTKQRTDSMTFEKQVTWSSHLVRRTVFTILLPLAGLGYTLSSNGTVHFMAPIIFAGLIGFLSTLAIAECNGLIMETFDTSDLQAGMTGRPRKTLPEEVKRKRTNFSCFPRVTAGFAIAQTFAFLIAAGATGWGGVIERHLGAQVATAVVAGILFILTLLLFAVLWRFKTVQIIPSQRYGTNVLSGPEDEWKPIIIGSPSGTTRRMSILELGNMSRWTEIRRRNKLGSVSGRTN